METDRIRRNYGLPCYHDHHPLWADFTEVLDEVDRLGAENADLRARLAEVEADMEHRTRQRDHARRLARGWVERGKAAEATLARVLAVPEAETVAPNVWVSGYNTALRNVRAAAEGDRAAGDCGCDGDGIVYVGNGSCGGCSGLPYGPLHEPSCGREPCGEPAHWPINRAERGEGDDRG